MSTLINNIIFDITNLTMTSSAPTMINFRGQTYQYNNINRTTIEMTATTSSSNYVSLMNWCNQNQHGLASTYKFDTIYNGFILKGCFPTSVEYNPYSNDINVNFSVDYSYNDNSLMKDFRRQQERKNRKEKLKKLDEICKS